MARIWCKSCNIENDSCDDQDDKDNPVEVKLKNFIEDLKEIGKNVSEHLSPLTGEDQVISSEESVVDLERRMVKTILSSYQTKVEQELSNQLVECGGDDMEDKETNRTINKVSIAKSNNEQTNDKNDATICQ